MKEQAKAALDRGEGLAANAWKEVKACLLDDLNTPAAIAALSEPLKVMNELLVVRKKQPVRTLPPRFREGTAALRLPLVPCAAKLQSSLMLCCSSPFC